MPIIFIVQNFSPESKKKTKIYKQGDKESPEFLRTHPLDQTRIVALQEFLPNAKREYKPL